MPMYFCLSISNETCYKFYMFSYYRIRNTEHIIFHSHSRIAIDLYRMLSLDAIVSKALCLPFHSNSKLMLPFIHSIYPGNFTYAFPYLTSKQTNKKYRFLESSPSFGSSFSLFYEKKKTRILFETSFSRKDILMIQMVMYFMIGYRF